MYVARDLLVAPHTFRKPTELTTAPPPAPGALAPALAGSRRRDTVVAFLRHLGCPFAEATMRQLVRLSAAHPAIDFVAVTHSSPARTRAWCDAVGGVGAVHAVADAGRTVYADWGVGLSDREHFAGRASLAGVRRLLAEGIHNRIASGSRWQRAAAFAVDAGGIVRWRHLPANAADLPVLGDAVAVLTGRSVG
ncbi:MAG: hypothetical protein JOZ47_20025 [Kutzneria sp.]|nr:hypothetical protein [Kutzneria sp.]